MIIKVAANISADSHSIYVFEEDHKGAPINYVTIEGGLLRRYPYDNSGVGDMLPFLVFTGEDERMGLMSELLDALLDYGIKPKKHILEEKERTALENHLADMRKIAFTFLNGRIIRGEPEDEG